MLHQLNGEVRPDNLRREGNQDPRIAQRIMFIAFGALGVLALIYLFSGDRVMA